MKPKPVFEVGERVTLTINQKTMEIIEAALSHNPNMEFLRGLDKATVVRGVLSYLAMISKVID